MELSRRAAPNLMPWGPICAAAANTRSDYDYKSGAAVKFISNLSRHFSLIRAVKWSAAPFLNGRLLYSPGERWKKKRVRLCWRGVCTPQEDMSGEKLIYRNFMGCQCERFKLKAIKYPGREQAPPFVGIPQRLCREILYSFCSFLSLTLSQPSTFLESFPPLL